MDQGFALSMSEMTAAMKIALTALYLKSEVDEKAEKRRMARSRDNLAGEKEELEARLKGTEEEKAGLAAQVRATRGLRLVGYTSFLTLFCIDSARRRSPN